MDRTGPYHDKRETQHGVFFVSVLMSCIVHSDATVRHALFFIFSNFLCLFFLTNTKKVAQTPYRALQGLPSKPTPKVQQLLSSSISMFLCLSSDNKYSDSTGKERIKKDWKPVLILSASHVFF